MPSASVLGEQPSGGLVGITSVGPGLFGYKLKVDKMFKHFKKFIRYGILVVIIILAFPKFSMILSVVGLDGVTKHLH